MKPLTKESGTEVSVIGYMVVYIAIVWVVVDAYEKLVTVSAHFETTNVRAVYTYSGETRRLDRLSLKAEPTFFYYD